MARPTRISRRARLGVASLLLASPLTMFVSPAGADPLDARMVDQGDNCDPDGTAYNDGDHCSSNLVFRGFGSGIYPNADRPVDQVASLDLFQYRTPSGEIDTFLAYCLDIDLPKSETGPYGSTIDGDPNSPTRTVGPFSVASWDELVAFYDISGADIGDLADAEQLAKARFLAARADEIGTPLSDVAREALAVQTAIYTLVDGAAGWLPTDGSADDIIDRVDELLAAADSDAVEEFGQMPVDVIMDFDADTYTPDENGEVTANLIAQLLVVDGPRVPVPAGTSIEVRISDTSLPPKVVSAAADGTATVVFTADEWAAVAEVGANLSATLVDGITVEAALIVPNHPGQLPQELRDHILASFPEGYEPSMAEWHLAMSELDPSVLPFLEEPVQPYVSTTPIVMNASASAVVLPVQQTPPEPPEPPVSVPGDPDVPAPPSTNTPPPVTDLPYTGGQLPVDVAILGAAAAAAGALVRARNRRNRLR